jgi:hypothetical protein
MTTLLIVSDVATAIGIILLVLQINQLRRQLKEQRRLGYKAHQQLTDLQTKVAEHEQWAYKSTEATAQITDILSALVNR